MYLASGGEEMVKNYAHRGFSGAYPENTMLAFRKAVEAGCDGIELDVHLSKDGELVIMHDERLNRTTDGNGFIKDYDYKEIRGLNAAHLYNGRYQHVPNLREYFEWVKGQSIISIIELKTNRLEYEGIEEKVNTLIVEYGLQDWIIICSFNPYSMERMKKINPTLKGALLVDRWSDDIGGYAKVLGMEYLHPYYRLMTLSRVDEIKSYGLGVNVWTVNEEKEMLEMIKIGVDGIITNYPNRLSKLKEDQL